MSFQDVGRPSPSPGVYAAYTPNNGGGTSSSNSNSSGGGAGAGARAGGSIGGSGGNGNGNGTPAGAAASWSGGLREALLQYQQQVTLYEKLGREVGGPRDDAELRAQLRAQEAVVKVVGLSKWSRGRVGCVALVLCCGSPSLFVSTTMQETGLRMEQQVGAQLRGADAASSALPKAEKDRLRAEANKMGKDAQRLKARFDNGVRQTQARVREVDLRAKREAAALDGAMAAAASASASGGSQQRQQQQALLHEDLDEGLLREREEELLRINQSVVKVNEIFRDLGELVARQQEDIDTIETNVERSHAAAKQGLEQVEKAAKYQPGCAIA